MPTDLVIYTFLIRRKRVVRQRRLEHCLSCTSANESKPDDVVLNKVCDKNGQRAPVGDGENMRAWDVVAQVAPQSGGERVHYRNRAEQQTHSV